MTHALVNVGRNTPARSSSRHFPASTCSISSRTIASLKNRAGSVRDEQDDEPSEIAHGSHGRLLRRLDRGRSGGRQHSPERFEQLPVGRAAVRSLRQHDGEAPPEQRIAHGVGGELQGERDEP